MELYLLFIAQLISSYLSVAKLHACIGDSLFKFVSWACISDIVKLSTYTSVAVVAVNGNWWGILVAVSGGVVGNSLAYTFRSK